MSHNPVRRFSRSSCRVAVSRQPRLREAPGRRGDAEQSLWPGFRREATTDWLAPLTEGMASIGRPELASVVLAVIRGLIMDLEATAETDRIDRAFTAFIATLDTRDPAAGPAHPDLAR